MHRPHAALFALTVTATPFAFAGDAPTIIQQPTDRALCSGSQTSFTVQASAGGFTPVTFDWQVESADGEWSHLPITPPAPGVWARVSVGVDEITNTSTLYFSWIGTVDTRRYRCLVSGPFGSAASDPARLTALTADFGSSGGQPAPDWHFDNNDFVAYIDAFFNNSQSADLGSAGGQLGGDGVLDNNDFIAIIDLFFNGCVELH
ncbi:MAG: GC-type dockerin domain-anchored protein [Phycisphaerales bacterium]|nr:GC-type dockerin domain-anchored protein [Phycisphaerales bacterium]